MTEHLDPLSAEALAVPLPADFVPAGDRYNLAERLSAAHEAAPVIAGKPHDPAALAVAVGNRRRPFLWGTLFAASLALHFSATYFFIKPPETAMIAGGGPTALPVLGNAFNNSLAAGENVAEPVETAPVETVDAQPPVQPQPTLAETPAEAADTQPTEPTETLPVAPETVAVAPAEQQSETVPPETTEAEPVETTEPVEPVAEAEPVTPQIEPVAPELQPIAPEPEPIIDAPIPIPRPGPPRPAPEPEPEPQPAPQPRQQGNQGQQDANRNAGSDTGRAEGQGGEASQAAAPANAAGNAAASNYPGEIVSRLRRALRYPSAARRDELSGEVLVTFTVTANGGVGGVSVARSSGFPILDQAAIETVQRAAPFPAIPPAAGRSSWQFSVPLAFAR